jgi:hypothetical protein
LSVMFRNDAPIIVSAKSFASRPHPRVANHTIAATVKTVRKKLEPTNDMKRMNNVMLGEANVCTAARVASSKWRMSPSKTWSASQPRNTSVAIAASIPRVRKRLRISSNRFFRDVSTGSFITALV